MTLRKHRSWWLALVTAAISAGLGTAINVATNSIDNIWAWLAVVVLTFAAALAAVASIRVVNTKAGHKEEPSSSVEISQQTLSGNDFRGARTVIQAFGGNFRVSHDSARTVAIVAIIVWIATASGLIIGAKTKNFGAAGATEQSVNAGPENATLTVAENRSVFYYPKDGALPTVPPPFYNYNDSQVRDTHCQNWISYLSDIGAAPTEPVLLLTAISGLTSPITVLDLKVEVYSSKTILSKKRIQCQYGAGGYGGARASVDLDHPGRPTELDIDDDGKPDTTLPGGRFVVDSKNAETLTISLNGTKGKVYEFAVRLRIAENGRERTLTLGNRNQPRRLAIEPDDEGLSQNPQRNPNENVDWDFIANRWAPAKETGYK